jgi:hypothetical protein
MYRYYRNPYHAQDQRFIGFGLPFVGGLLGGLIGGALVTRPFWGYPYPCCYPGFGFAGAGYPGVGYPGVGFQGPGYPVQGYPGVGYPGYPR